MNSQSLGCLLRLSTRHINKVLPGSAVAEFGNCIINSKLVVNSCIHFQVQLKSHVHRFSLHQTVQCLWDYRGLSVVALYYVSLSTLPLLPTFEQKRGDTRWPRLVDYTIRVKDS
jgi:hypothetical protein